MQMYAKSIPYSNRILKERISGGVLLDVGGSECVLRANALAEAVDEVVILDLKPPAGVLAENVRFLEMPIEKLGCSQGEYDHILFSNVLEHLDDPAIALVNARKVLAQGGSVHILSPNCESLNRRIGVRMGVMKHARAISDKEIAIGHKHALTVKDIEDFAAASGLRIVECRGVFLKPVPTPEMIMWSEGRIEAFFAIAEQIPPELCHEVYFRAV